MHKGSAGSRKVELYDMIQIDDCGPMDAKKAFGVQTLTDLLHRHSMFISGILQVQPNQIAMALNPYQLADAN